MLPSAIIVYNCMLELKLVINGCFGSYLDDSCLALVPTLLVLSSSSTFPACRGFLRNLPWFLTAHEQSTSKQSHSLCNVVTFSQT